MREWINGLVTGMIVYFMLREELLALAICGFIWIATVGGGDD